MYSREVRLTLKLVSETVLSTYVQSVLMSVNARAFVQLMKGHLDYKVTVKSQKSFICSIGQMTHDLTTK